MNGPAGAGRRGRAPYDGTDVLRAGLLGLLVATYAALIYLGLILLATAAWGGTRYFDQPPAWLAAAALGVVASTLRPVGRWLKTGVDGILLGPADDTAAVLARLGAVLEAAGRDPEAGLSRRDEARLAEIARQLGAVVYAEALTADVRAARERLVAAREEERRRIRNDLHDGIGPMLSALKLQLDALAPIVEQDPTTSRRIDALREDLRATTAEVRRLVEGLRPPALDALGLVAAVRQLADAAGGAIDVEAVEPLPPLAAAVEVAAYRIAAEAIHNIQRHAPGARGTVRIAIAAGTLRLEVVDDGPGPRHDRAIGVGTASMSDRAAELRGTLVVGAAPGGGTRVVASLPVALDPPTDPPERARWTP